MCRQRVEEKFKKTSSMRSAPRWVEGKYTLQKVDFDRRLIRGGNDNQISVIHTQRDTQITTIGR